MDSNKEQDLTVKGDEPSYRAPEPRDLTKLRRYIEQGEYDEVEELIWSNPRYLVTVCDSAVYLMSGPKYNACHIAARSNKPDIMALILDAVSNLKFLRKLYPDEPDQNVQVRSNHLLDSYLNTPDPRGGNTPLHFACKKGYHSVVRVILTHEGIQKNLKDSAGHTAEETICEQLGNGDKEAELKKKIQTMFKKPLNHPLYKDQLKKKLLIERRARSNCDSSFSDISFTEDFSNLSLG